MRTFTAYFDLDAGYAEREIEADSIEEAMEKAKAINDEGLSNADFVEHFEPTADAGFIRVTDQETEEEIEWRCARQKMFNCVDEMRAFIELCARFNYDGEEREGQEPFDLPSDDAVTTVFEVVTGARKLLEKLEE